MRTVYSLLCAIIIAICVIMMPPAGFSSKVAQVDGPCEDCHSSFEAFDVIIDAPKEVPADYKFDYRVIVKNNGEHEVQDLQVLIDLSEAKFLKTTLEGGEPYHEEISGSVGIRQTATYTFSVSRGASQVIVFLDGAEGLLGVNDLDMTVTGPNGDQKSSANSGPDEAVLLTSRELKKWGYGECQVSIVWFVGSPSISFTLTIDVEYGEDQILLEGQDIGPKKAYTFVVPLESTEQGENAISARVTGTAYHDHSGQDETATNNSTYTVEETSSLTVGTKYVYSKPDTDGSGSVSVLLIERILGLVSGFMLFVSIGFSGLLPVISVKMERLVGGVSKRIKWHCRTSQILLGAAFLHALMLPFSPHASSLRGLLPGSQALIIMGFLGYFGWKQDIFRKKWGNEKWKKIHLVLTILAIVIVVLHAVMDGTDFSFLLG